MKTTGTVTFTSIVTTVHLYGVTYCENYFLVLACSINDLSSWEHLFTKCSQERERTKDITAHKFFLFSIPANLKVVYTSIPSHQKNKIARFHSLFIQGEEERKCVVCYFAAATSA